jgi:hypothetical protein
VQKLFINIITFLFVSLFSISAQADQTWEVRRISGSAWLLQNGQNQVLLKKNSMVQPGNMLKTGDRSRVLLARGKERIQVGSNTVLSIPDDAELKPGETKIKLKSGELDLIVKKMPHKHFSVETPFIAAVVKGTHFTVSTTSTRSLVRVFEGLVGVSSMDSDEQADIRPGKSASLTYSSETQTRLLLLDNPPQARMFEGFPEVFPDLSIPNPSLVNRSGDKDMSVGGIVDGTIALILTAAGTALSSIGSTLYEIFAPIIVPAMKIINQIYSSILPNSTFSLLVLSVVVGLALFGLIAYTIRKRQE